jgi:K+-sensing histidine kinase KdpD
MESILEKIYTITLDFLEPLTLSDTYKKIVQGAVKLVNGDDGLIVLRENGKFKNHYGSSPDAARSQPKDKGNTYRSYAKNQAFVLHTKDYKKTHPDLEKQDLHSVIFIPLHYKRKSFGVLIVRSRLKEYFSNEELRILKLFGSLASLSIRKTQLYVDSKKNIELKDKFLAIAAHELRTPLTSMSGFIQLIHKKTNEGKPVNINWTETLLTESGRLTLMIEEILDINKINAHSLKFNYQPYPLQEIVQESVDKVRPLYPSHSFSFKISGKNTVVVGDKKYLAKALFNVIENAAKFTSEKNSIQISLNSDKSHSIITIKDKGRGIKAEDISHVFEGFYKASGNEQEGMGLGLYYSQNVIKQHKGVITLDSQENKGTEVTIKLPAV